VADQTLTSLLSADPLRATLEGTVTLDGVRLGLRLWMASRDFRWRIDVFDSAGARLIQGHGLVAQADVFHPYRALNPGLPGGQLFVLPAALDGSEPSGFAAFRSTHAVKYRPAADVTE
jgi:hypothetical protein